MQILTSISSQINMDYSLCKALTYNMEAIPIALVMYDIMCQYGVHLQDRVEKSPEISLSSSLELRTGIGLFHIHGHQDSCLPRFSPSYIPGAKQVDGEIIILMGTTEQHISEHPRDVPCSSAGGIGCTHEPFQLEEDDTHWYVASIC